MLDQILAVLISYQYLALFAIVFFAALLNITPASPTLIAAGSLVALGRLDYSLVFLFGLIGSFAGDLSAYGLAFFYGQEVLMRFGFKRLFSSAKFQQIEKSFAQHSTRTIFISRFFLTSFGPVINLAAGLAKINSKIFIICSFIGQIIYVLLLTGIGYFGARHWRYISNLYDYFGVVLVAMTLYLLYRNFFRRVAAC